jgi:tetrahydromethanopterin S-methyltransferase subunit D
MAKGNVQGPLGPLMLAMLIGIGIFMVFVTQSPELASNFVRPEGFYDNTFEKVGYALLFAAVASVAFAVIKRLIK